MRFVIANVNAVLVGVCVHGEWRECAYGVGVGGEGVYMGGECVYVVLVCMCVCVYICVCVRVCA